MGSDEYLHNYLCKLILFDKMRILQNLCNESSMKYYILWTGFFLLSSHSYWSVSLALEVMQHQNLVLQPSKIIGNSSLWVLKCIWCRRLPSCQGAIYENVLNAFEKRSHLSSSFLERSCIGLKGVVLILKLTEWSLISPWLSKTAITDSPFDSPFLNDRYRPNFWTIPNPSLPRWH